MIQAARRGRVIAALAVGAAVFATAMLTARPAVVQRWNIYASATGARSDAYTMFLGPFPTNYSCEVEARIIVKSGGHAYCRGSVALELGSAGQALLWNEFWPSARWIGLCEARVNARALHQPVRVRTSAAGASRRFDDRVSIRS